MTVTKKNIFFRKAKCWPLLKLISLISSLQLSNYNNVTKLSFVFGFFFVSFLLFRKLLREEKITYPTLQFFAPIPAIYISTYFSFSFWVLCFISKAVKGCFKQDKSQTRILRQTCFDVKWFSQKISKFFSFVKSKVHLLTVRQFDKNRKGNIKFRNLI